MNVAPRVLLAGAGARRGRRRRRRADLPLAPVRALHDLPLLADGRRPAHPVRTVALARRALDDGRGTPAPPGRRASSRSCGRARATARPAEPRDRPPSVAPRRPPPPGRQGDARPPDERRHHPRLRGRGAGPSTARSAASRGAPRARHRLLRALGRLSVAEGLRVPRPAASFPPTASASPTTPRSTGRRSASTPTTSSTALELSHTHRPAPHPGHGSAPAARTRSSTTTGRAASPPARASSGPLARARCSWPRACSATVGPRSPRQRRRGSPSGFSPIRRLSIWTEGGRAVPAGHSRARRLRAHERDGVEVYRGVWLSSRPSSARAPATPSGGSIRTAFELNLLPRTHWNIGLSYYRRPGRAPTTS